MCRVSHREFIAHANAKQWSPNDTMCSMQRMVPCRLRRTTKKGIEQECIIGVVVVNSSFNSIAWAKPITVVPCRHAILRVAEKRNL